LPIVSHFYQTPRIPVVLRFPPPFSDFSDFSAMSQDGGVGDPIPSSHNILYLSSGVNLSCAF
jgi:hypothetical protein